MSTVTYEDVKKFTGLIIDVREEDELSYGMIPHAKHIVLHDLEDSFKLSPEDFKVQYGFHKPSKDEKIIVYCRTGSRSAIAQSLLNHLGYTAYNYKGSIQEWSQYDKNVLFY